MNMARNIAARDLSNATVYAHTARFDGTARALTEDEIYSLAPSVFAVEKHESRSARFQPIPTIEILRGLMKEGFAVVGAAQSRTRDPSKRDFTRHLLRLRRLGDNVVVNNTVFEVLLRNANDGTASYDMYAGLFRKICDNSLVSSTGQGETVRVRHTGDVRTKVIEGSYTVLDTAEETLGQVDRWSSIGVNRDERLLLAQAAHVARFGEANGVEADRLLAPRRFEDRQEQGTLWGAFNIVQENAVRGGLHGYNETTRRRVTTREVKGIDQLVGLNKALWMITNHFAEQKAAA